MGKKIKSLSRIEGLIYISPWLIGFLALQLYPFLASLYYSFTDYAMKGRTYRYMEVPALYPFGYGLSYTSYEYSGLKTEEDGDGVNVSVTVENRGDWDGDEVVELYIKDLDSEFEVRNHRLAAFERVALKAGEKKEVTLHLGEKAFQIVDEGGNRRKDGSRFAIYVGGSQPDERSAALLGQKPLETVINK